jgi:UDP-glucose 4-epimerase
MKSSKEQSRRVLVTGGAGFIGSHIVRRLASDGHAVTILDDLSSGSTPRTPPEVNLIQTDVSGDAAIHAINETRPDLIIHAAAQVSVPGSMADPDRDRAINLEGTQHVVEGARRAGSRMLVFLSSGGAIYGETDMGTEQSTPNPASYYGIHKLAAEGYLRLGGLPFANLRLANVYGPNQRTDLEGGVVAIFMERLRAGLPITIHGTGEQVRDFVHVADVVSAVLTASQSDQSGTWNVGTGVGSSVRTLLTELEALIGPATEIRHEPPRDGDVLVSRLAIDRIAHDLGWTPRFSLASGLRQLVDSLETSAQ